MTARKPPLTFTRHLRRGLLAAALAVAPAACVQEERVEVETVDQAISGGAADHTAPYVVRVGKSCTGTLVTPRHVLTANHCITGLTANEFKESKGMGGPEADYTIYLLPYGFDSIDDQVCADGAEAFNIPGTPVFCADGSDPKPVVQKFVHTYAESGPVIVMAGDKQLALGPFDNTHDAERDLAIILLDKPVPAEVATPLHPPILDWMDPCPEKGDVFGATIVGFNGGATKESRFNKQHHREGVGNTYGEFFTHEWLLPVPVVDPAFGIASLPWFANQAVFGNVYGGIEGGDSGGPLLYKTVDQDGRNYQVRLCGVASGTYPTTAFDLLQCGITGVCWAVGQRHVALDSEEAIDWLLPRLTYVNKFGDREFLGECGGVGDDVDTNCDLEPDACEPQEEDTKFEAGINCISVYDN